MDFLEKLYTKYVNKLSLIQKELQCCDVTRRIQLLEDIKLIEEFLYNIKLVMTYI